MARERSEKLLGKGFETLTADRDWIGYGGKWYLLADHRRYYVVEFLNFQDAGCWEAGQDRYNVEVSEVDLDRFEAYQIANALESCGPGRNATDVDDLTRVESLHSYGNRAPMWQASGNNAGKLMRAAGAQVRTFEVDSDERDEALNGRAVNRMGQDAASYAGYKLPSKAEQAAAMAERIEELESAVDDHQDEITALRALLAQLGITDRQIAYVVGSADIVSGMRAAGIAN